MFRKFDRYIALGDSLSIDLYPGLDVVERGDPSYTGPPPGGLGAVSLFFRNDDARWPEFAGRDPASLAPGIAFRNEHQHTGPRTIEGDHFATDAATSTGVLAYQLARVPPSDERTLFTVTSGLFDVVQMMGAPNPPPTLVEGMLSRTERLLRTIAGKRPDSLVLLGTVVDPSDGTGELETLEPFARERNWIESYNLALREVIRPALQDKRIAGAEKVGAHKTSMLQDLERSRPMEIEPLVTVVQEMGRMLDVATPTLDVVLALVQQRAKMAGLN